MLGTLTMALRVYFFHIAPDEGGSIINVHRHAKIFSLECYVTAIVQLPRRLVTVYNAY